MNSVQTLVVVAHVVSVQAVANNCPKSHVMQSVVRTKARAYFVTLIHVEMLVRAVSIAEVALKHRKILASYSEELSTKASVKGSMVYPVMRMIHARRIFWLQTILTIALKKQSQLCN